MDCELRGGEPGQLSLEKGSCRGPPLGSPRVEGTDRSLSSEPGAVTLGGSQVEADFSSGGESTFLHPGPLRARTGCQPGNEPSVSGLVQIGLFRLDSLTW